jgi:SPP1 gp7 family putative phage head morphogenesis protein
MMDFKTRDLRRQDTRKQREAFERARRAERHYVMQLRKVARSIGQIVKAFPPGDPMAEPIIRRALEDYSTLIMPWSRATAQAMLMDVNRRDERAWRTITEAAGSALREEIRRAPTGLVFQQKMREQVDLITSLPLEAAQRVHKLTIAGMAGAERADVVREMILRQSDVSEARAMLIARTEVGRASGSFTESRAQFIGSPGYIWRTAGDSDVRERHKKLAGKYFEWGKPPVTGERGERSLPGGIYNCRCYPEVILPEEYR